MILDLKVKERKTDLTLEVGRQLLWHHKVGKLAVRRIDNDNGMGHRVKARTVKLTAKLFIKVSQ